MSDVLQIAKELISLKSVSGEADEGAIKYLENYLSKLGFKIFHEEFSGDGSYNVENFYAEFGNGNGKNLCFAGHTDVVPAGDLEKWTGNPFLATESNGYLIGRGTVDMKGAIAAWVAASNELLDENFKFDGKLSFLITGDEEADAVNGTVKLLRSITDKKIKIDSCIVGEPTNPSIIGEMAKIGRRGSISFKLTVTGLQGHVAYPEKANNPLPFLVEILNKLENYKFDSGNKFFQPSNLEITSIDVGNSASNIIPNSASARFNIRFNSEHNLKYIENIIQSLCVINSDAPNAKNIKVDLEILRGKCESFISTPGKLSKVVSESVSEVCGSVPELSTTGGTSDARFIKDYAEVVEFGLINETAHKIDEKVKIEELYKLKDIYKKIIITYFS